MHSNNSLSTRGLEEQCLLGQRRLVVVHVPPRRHGPGRVAVEADRRADVEEGQRAAEARRRRAAARALLRRDRVAPVEDAVAEGVLACVIIEVRLDGRQPTNIYISPFNFANLSSLNLFFPQNDDPARAATLQHS